MDKGDYMMCRISNEKTVIYEVLMRRDLFFLFPLYRLHYMNSTIEFVCLFFCSQNVSLPIHDMCNQQ